MSHEISIQNGKAEIAWAGHRPWHGLGAEMKNRMPAMEALKIAGLDWEVEKWHLSYSKLGQEAKIAPDVFATVRTDTGAYLGHVGSRYVPLQNREQAGFIDALVDGGAVVEVVGALYGGARTFWTCKLPEDIIVETAAGTDRTEQYLLITNGHDGMEAFRAYWTKVRVVCNNTWRASITDRKDGISIRHTASVQAHVKEAGRLLGIATETSKKEAAAMQALEEIKITGMAHLHSLFEAVLEPEKGSEDALTAEQKDKRKADRIEMRNLWVGNVATETELTRPRLRGISRWDAFNAITYYVSHQQTEIKAGKRQLEKQETRFDRVLFGSGHRLVGRALEVMARPAATLVGSN